MQVIFKSDKPIEDFVAFNRSHVWGGSRIIILSAIAVMLIVLGVVQVLFDSLILGIVLFVVAALYLPFIFLLTELSITKHLKSNPAYCAIKQCVNTFNDDYILSESFSDTGVDANKYYYNQIYKVIEKKSYFYIYVNNKSAIIVNKDGLTEGSTEEVREKLNSINSKLKKLKTKN